MRDDGPRKGLLLIAAGVVIRSRESLRAHAAHRQSALGSFADRSLDICCGSARHSGGRTGGVFSAGAPCHSSRSGHHTTLRMIVFILVPRSIRPVGHRGICRLSAGKTSFPCRSDGGFALRMIP